MGKGLLVSGGRFAVNCWGVMRRSPFSLIALDDPGGHGFEEAFITRVRKVAVQVREFIPRGAGQPLRHLTGIVERSVRVHSLPYPRHVTIGTGLPRLAQHAT